MRKVKLAVVVLLIMMLVAACSSGNKDNSPGTNGGNTNVNSETNNGGSDNNPPEEEPPAQEREINMNGETLKIIHWGAGPSEETPEGAAELARWREAEEKYNVKIVWEKVPWGEPINMVTNAALTGESVADIVPLDLYQAIPAVYGGLFMPVDDFFDFTDPKWPAGMQEHGKINGKMYGFTSNISNASGLYYNKTMFEREGIEDPHSLVEKGEWTWDKLLEISQQLTKDTDGDGVTDQYGITNVAPTLARILIYSNGSELVANKDGKFVYNYEDPALVEALRFYSDLFNVHKVVAPNNHGNFEDYNESQTLFSAGKAGMVTGEVWEGEARTGMTDEQGFVYFPKGPKATTWQGSIENYVQFYIPANVKRAEEKAYIWEQIQMWDRIDQVNREGAEKQLLADEKDIETMLDLLKYAKPIFLPLGDSLGGIAYGIANNGESPETALERTRQVAQDAINAAYAQ